VKETIRFICIAIFLFSFYGNVWGQKKGPYPEPEKSWGLGVLPAVSYDTDLGFQYGALANFYLYGTRAKYPDYEHSFYFEISRYTNSSGLFRIYYDSEYLFPGIFLNADLSYMPESAYDFYGFNGFESRYQSDWEDEDSPDYRSRMFYRYQRKYFRFKVDLQGKLSGDNVRWIAGFNLQHFSVGSVDIEKFNENKKEEDRLPSIDSIPGLYERYIDWGLIEGKETDGGSVPALKAGLVYDTRDEKKNPSKGIWSEAVIEVVPCFARGKSDFAKLSLIHRQYFPLVPEKLTLAYRLVYQGSLWGDVPFYYQSQLITSILTGSSSEGLGGAKSLRGVKRNRVIGDAIFLGNLELRWKFWNFKFMKQDFYCGINSFMDMGRTLKSIPIKDKVKNIENQEDYFEPGAEKMHYSYGLGVKAAMNKNFIVSVDFGLAADQRDGKSGLYMGLNYLF